MGNFSVKEIEYLRSQRLARLATVDAGGAPHVVPVGFRIDPEGDLEIGGHGLSRSKKWRDMQANPHIAIVVDDLASVNPWTPRGIEVRGRAELHTDGGEKFGSGWDSAWVRVVPKRVVSWGIEGAAFTPGGRHARSVRD